MLSGLLPGIRQIRTPLAAGYLIAATLALASGLTAARGLKTPLFQDLSRLATAGGRGPTLAAITFAAYLAGVIWVPVWQNALRLSGRYLGGRTRREIFATTANAVNGGLSGANIRRLSELVQRRLDNETTRPDSPTSRNFRNTLGQLAQMYTDRRASDGRERLLAEGTAALLPAAAAELLDLVPARLVSADREIWNSWDQTHAEAEFRSTVAIPAGAVFAALAWTYGSLWLIGLIVSPLLLYTAAKHSERATAILVEAVRVKQIPLFVNDDDMPELSWTVADGTTADAPPAVAARARAVCAPIG